jgi:hypothetical protein
VSKEHHKSKARELFKICKNVPQLKALGAESLNNKSLVEVPTANRRKTGFAGNIP